MTGAIEGWPWNGHRTPAPASAGITPLPLTLGYLRKEDALRGHPESCKYTSTEVPAVYVRCLSASPDSLPTGNAPPAGAGSRIVGKSHGAHGSAGR